jgi:hypothetical protein
VTNGVEVLDMALLDWLLAWRIPGRAVEEADVCVGTRRLRLSFVAAGNGGS